LEFYGKNYPDVLETSYFLKFISNIWKIMSEKPSTQGCSTIKRGVGTPFPPHDTLDLG